MNNYLDQLDTSKTININICMHPVEVNCLPDCTVRVNNNLLLNKTVDQFTCINYDVKILDTIIIEVELLNKKSTVDKQAVIIDSITVDNIELIPRFNHLIEYYDLENNPVFSPYIGFSGVWKLNINEPFYRWFHRHSNYGWLLYPAIVDNLL